MEIKIGNVKKVIYYINGSKKGDNLSPTLFLLVMQALHEFTSHKWEDSHINILSFFHATAKPENKGKLLRTTSEE